MLCVGRLVRFAEVLIGLRNLIMGIASIKKAKNPSKSKSRLLEGNKTAKKPISSSSVKLGCIFL